MIFLTVVACETGRNSYFTGTDQRAGSGVWWELLVIGCTNSDPLETWISLGSAFFAYFLFRQLCRLWSALQILLRSRNNASSLKTSTIRKRYKAEAKAARNSRKTLSSWSLSNSGRKAMVTSRWLWRCSLFLYLLFITLCKLFVYIYYISICYTSDTKSLDEAVSNLNVCDKKKQIDRAYEFKSRDAMLSFVTGRLKRALHAWKLI